MSKLTLGDTYSLDLLTGTRDAIHREGQAVDVVIVVNAGPAQRIIELLKVGRHDPIAQLHC